MVTPFREDERIDFSAWQTILDSLIGAGVDGVLVAGGQGEFFSLDDEERTVVLRFCKQAVAGRVTLYGNVGCVTTRATVKLAQAGEAEGLDYLVVITPYYLKPTQQELADHYIEVCRAVHVPVLAYNIPERTGVELEPATVAQIAGRCENFLGLKDSSGHLERIVEMRTAIPGRELAVFVGRDHLIVPALERGAVGAVAACANVAPKLFVDLYRAFREGNREEAVRLQALAGMLRETFTLHTFPSVVKEAMRMAGLPAGHCRRPVGPMPEKAQQQLAAVIARLREDNYLPHAPRAVPA